jgi:hypothetical protein
MLPRARQGACGMVPSWAVKALQMRRQEPFRWREQCLEPLGYKRFSQDFTDGTFLDGRCGFPAIWRAGKATCASCTRKDPSQRLFSRAMLGRFLLCCLRPRSHVAYVPSTIGSASECRPDAGHTGQTPPNRNDSVRLNPPPAGRVEAWRSPGRPPPRKGRGLPRPGPRRVPDAAGRGVVRGAEHAARLPRH